MPDQGLPPRTLALEQPRDVLWRARAPLRISFVGGGTDFPQVYETLGGATLTVAITLYAVATLRAGATGPTRLRSIDLDREVRAGTPEAARVLPLHDAAARAFRLGDGYTLETVSPVPAGSGLGSSSALMASIVAALARNAGQSPTPRELARLAWFVERKVAGLPGGVQDQWATAIGGVCSMQFSAAGVSATRLQLPGDTLAELEGRLLLLRRGGPPASESATLRPANTGPANPDPAYVATMLQLADDMRRALVEGKVQQFCVLSHEAWQAKQRLTGPQDTAIADAYEAALRHGVLGGKQLGGPGGGHLLLLADPADQQAVRAALAPAGWQPMSIAIAPDGVSAWSGRHW